MPTLQANTAIEKSSDRRKYEVGRPLRFIGYNPEELACAPGDGCDWPLLPVGSIMVPVERNGCGMGIDCWNDADDEVYMVWSEEVEII